MTGGYGKVSVTSPGLLTPQAMTPWSLDVQDARWLLHGSGKSPPRLAERRWRESNLFCLPRLGAGRSQGQVEGSNTPQRCC